MKNIMISVEIILVGIIIDSAPNLDLSLRITLISPLRPIPTSLKVIEKDLEFVLFDQIRNQNTQIVYLFFALSKDSLFFNVNKLSNFLFAKSFIV